MPHQIQVQGGQSSQQPMGRDRTSDRMGHQATDVQVQAAAMGKTQVSANHRYRPTKIDVQKPS